ncbi:KTSC domain-containing protein [Caulobacter segnis]|uniref:KTSC domain-containing protein n=1 Tax=Caulobacter segnis TaxID=88688 RepID=A0ABM6TFP0_9CAUL|nr:MULTISPECIES: KTSC domain-containing protein [Caulobacter]AVQ01941.1 KTSC domain-containing protein [Caulobacter segnis]SFJ31297.1 KTSC domain-containing protein [Caulobacter sp. UNC279MFTsu5.1]
MIKAFAYDAANQVLTITFVSGRAYAYSAVPADVAEGLRLALAKGEYFNKAIRDRFDAEAVAGTPGQPRSLF